MMRSNAATNPLCRHERGEVAGMVILTPAAFECFWTPNELPDPPHWSWSHRAGDPYGPGVSANGFRDHWGRQEPEGSPGGTWQTLFLLPPKVWGHRCV
jgi:hypothetical protein